MKFFIPCSLAPFSWPEPKKNQTYPLSKSSNYSKALWLNNWGSVHLMFPKSLRDFRYTWTENYWIFFSKLVTELIPWLLLEIYGVFPEFFLWIISGSSSQSIYIHRVDLKILFRNSCDPLSLQSGPEKVLFRRNNNIYSGAGLKGPPIS